MVTNFNIICQIFLQFALSIKWFLEYSNIALSNRKPHFPSEVIFIYFSVSVIFDYH